MGSGQDRISLRIVSQELAHSPVMTVAAASSSLSQPCWGPASQLGTILSSLANGQRDKQKAPIAA